MSDHEQQLEFDFSDLGNLETRINIPQPRPIESLENLIQRIGSTSSYPKDEMRKLWVKNMSERDKAVKQLKLCDDKLKYWIAKRNFTVSVISQINMRLQEIEPHVLSDIMTR